MNQQRLGVINQLLRIKNIRELSARNALISAQSHLFSCRKNLERSKLRFANYSANAKREIENEFNLLVESGAISPIAIQEIEHLTQITRDEQDRLQTEIIENEETVLEAFNIVSVKRQTYQKMAARNSAVEEVANDLRDLVRIENDLFWDELDNDQFAISIRKNSKD